MADDPVLVRRWLAQWRETGAALAKLRRAELTRITDDQARAASAMLLSLADSSYVPLRRRRYSGLVAQQVLFRALRGS